MRTRVTGRHTKLMMMTLGEMAVVLSYWRAKTVGEVRDATMLGRDNRVINCPMTKKTRMVAAGQETD